MKHIKFTALALAAVFMLAGCGKKQNTPAIKEANLGEEIVMNVGGEKVTKSEFNYYLSTYQQQTDSSEAKKLAVSYCENHNLLIAVGKAMGVEFDRDTKKEIENSKKQIMANYEKNGGYRKFLKSNDLSDDYMQKLVEVGYYSEALKGMMEKKEYTEEEKKDFFRNNYRRAKHILLSTKDAQTNAELPEDKQAEIKAQAEELLNRAKSGENFDILVKEYSEDPGSESYPDGYVFTDNEMVEEFQNGVDSVKPGEFILVKTSYGYHVIQRLSLEESAEYFDKEYANVADNLTSVMDSKRFEEQVRKWAEEKGIKTVIEQEIIDAME